MGNGKHSCLLQSHQAIIVQIVPVDLLDYGSKIIKLLFFTSEP